MQGWHPKPKSTEKEQKNKRDDSVHPASKKKFSTSYLNRGPLKVLNDSAMILKESEWPSWSFKTNFESFRTFTDPLFFKQITENVFFETWYVPSGSKR